MKKLIILLLLLIFGLVGCNGDDNEQVPENTPYYENENGQEQRPEPPDATVVDEPITPDFGIRLAFNREPSEYFMDVATRAQEHLPEGSDFSITNRPIGDSEELARRLGLSSDDPEMINAIIVSLSDFAQIYNAGGHLRLVSLLSGDGGGGFYGLFLREGLVRQAHLSGPFVAGVIRSVDALMLDLPEALHVDNYDLLSWDNDPLTLVFKRAFGATGETFSRDMANHIFYPRLIPRPDNAGEPTITYITDFKLAFEGEFVVELSAVAMSPDGGQLSFQWYCADTGEPLPGETSNTLNVFGNEPASLEDGVYVMDFRFFLRVTNNNPDAAGVQYAYTESDEVTVTLMREPMPPYVLLREESILFQARPRGNTEAIFIDNQERRIRDLVNDHIVGRPVEFILIEGHYNASPGRRFPSGNDLILCHNRAEAVGRVMRDMGVYIPIITRYNPDQSVAATEELRRSATVRLFGID